MASSRFYDVAYRWGWAPWDEVGVRDEFLALLAAGEVTPATHPRAIDLGCGTGANVVALATRGFDMTGVDLSTMALRKAEARARAAGVGERCQFFKAGSDRSIVAAGNRCRVRPAARRRHARRPAARGACTHGSAHRAVGPARGDHAVLVLLRGQARAAPRQLPRTVAVDAGIEPGEEAQLFGEDFEIADFSRPHPHAACFLLHRRARSRSA